MTDLDLLENDLLDAITIREEALVKGHVASWEEFKYLTGVVAGLKGALDAVNEAQRRYEDA
jgi:hypothetical protein